MNPIDWLLHAHVDALGTQIYWREIIGNGFGLLSAIGGMRRQVWAWPVGIIGNVLLFTVFIGGAFIEQEGQALFGQAGRQVFFVITSVYGWWRWQSNKSAGGGVAVVPRWATAPERMRYLTVFAVGVVACFLAFLAIGATWPAPWWFHLADSWIFVGSILATYAMARGWVDFWLLWIAVDVVGIPLLLQAKYYPSALLYAVYGGFVIWGFVVWLRLAREDRIGKLGESVPSADELPA